MILNAALALVAVVLSVASLLTSARIEREERRLQKRLEELRLGYELLVESYCKHTQSLDI